MKDSNAERLRHQCKRDDEQGETSDRAQVSARAELHHKHQGWSLWKNRVQSRLMWKDVLWMLHWLWEPAPLMACGYLVKSCCGSLSANCIKAVRVRLKRLAMNQKWQWKVFKQTRWAEQSCFSEGHIRETPCCRQLHHPSRYHPELTFTEPGPEYHNLPRTLWAKANYMLHCCGKNVPETWKRNVRLWMEMERRRAWEMLTPQSFLVTNRLKTNLNQPKLKWFINIF